MSAPLGVSAGQERLADSDGDGISDVEDRCPVDAGLPPDGCPPQDSDGDQIIDRLDRCPHRAGPRSGDGCPDRDGDRDGVVDRLDDCPGVFGHPTFNGCVPPDLDGDGYADPFDKCPDEAEIWNGVSDGDGCSDRGEAVLDVSAELMVFRRPLPFHADDRSLAKRGRADWQVAVTALEAARTRAVRIFIVAEHGLSYGDSLQRAQRRGEALRKMLAASTKLELAGIAVAIGPPDGRPRIEITYR